MAKLEEKWNGQGPAHEPSIAETRELMAETGDVAGLWRVVTTLSWVDFDHSEVFRLLLRAIEVRSMIDPAGFSADMHARIVGLVSYLLMRTEFRLNHLIAQSDQTGQRHGPPQLTHEITDVVVPRLLELQHHLLAALESQARTTRLWRLADQHRPDVRRATQQARAMQAQRCLAMESPNGRLPDSVDREQSLHLQNGARGLATTKPAPETSAARPAGPPTDCRITPQETLASAPASCLNGAIHGRT